TQNMYEFDALVGMRSSAFAGWRKFRKVGMEFALAGTQVELAQKTSIMAGRIAGNGPLSFFPSRDRDYALPFVISKKVIESHIEHESDTKQRGDRGKMLAVLNPREQRRREAGAFTELQQPHAAPQAKDPELRPNEITRKLKSQTIGKLHLASAFRKISGPKAVTTKRSMPASPAPGSHHQPDLVLQQYRRA